MAEAPKNQLALVAENFQGDFTIKEIPVPEIEEDEILVNLEYSGICHTDVHCHEGIYGPLVKLPYIGGHEGSGRIVKLGGNVKNWKIGDKVGVQMMNNACSSCEFCKKEKHFLCPSIVEFGVSRPGTFQQYIAVKPYDAVKLPDHADLSIIAPILCAGVTIYSALRQCNLLPGECVALSGAGGGLGSLGIQYAKSMGYRVLAIDHSSKEQHCRSLGADYFVDAFSENLVPYIVQQTDGGPHAIINMANSMKAVNDAILYLRKGSIIVQLSVPKESNLEINVIYLVMKCITLKGSMVGSRAEMATALDLAVSGIVKVPVDIVSMAETSTAFEAIRSGKVTGRKVIDLRKP